MSRNRRLLTYLPAVLLFVLAGIVWQGAVIAFRIPAVLLPLPSNIVADLVDPAVNWPYHIGITALEVVSGFMVALVTGVAVAVMIVLSPWLSRLLMPYVLLAQIAPKVAFAPLLFPILGYNLLPSILITFLVAFFPIVINTAAGLTSVDPRMRDLLRSLQASRWDVLVKAEFPASLPFLFSGLKVSSTLAVIGANVAEFVSAKAGLGFLIINAQVTFNTSLAFAAATFLVLLGVAFYALVVCVERLAMPWARALPA
ncbi:MAG: ABC transporter permease [Burkholderiales bacterium]|nr:ABC transporter permease [Burkholderiales bacterium]